MDFKKFLLFFMFGIICSAGNPGKNSSNPDSKLLLPKNCGIQSNNIMPENVEGDTTTLGMFPWLAVFDYQLENGGLQSGNCIGSLISNRYVLTAAQCLITRSWPGPLKQVRLGDYNVLTDPDCLDDENLGRICADPVLVVPVERLIIHEKYHKPTKYQNDIGLVRLSREVTFTKYIQPICLPSSNDTGTFYWFAGWGLRNFWEVNLRTIKFKVNLPHVNFDSCARDYAKYSILGKGQMCAGGVLGKSTCSGDGGGALMREVVNNGTRQYTAVGIVSFANGACGDTGFPEVGTRVYHYLPWILSNLQP